MKYNKKEFCKGIGFLLAFAIWTILIQIADVKPVGVNGTCIGFASVNTWFHSLTGVHMTIYTITDWLGLVPIMVCLIFGIIGLYQLVRRKSIFKVDKDIVLLGFYYVIVIFAYLIFEMIPINYRPILIGGFMEFGTKLQELRKAKGLTQEELAESLYVSRTAVSKWESGRGYPNIDSLKEISKFFSITIDELICSEEIIIAAKDERENSLRKFATFICSVLDIFIAILLFIPVFGNGALSKSAVSLFMMTDIQPWIKCLFFVLIIITVLNGICGTVISGMDRPVWTRHRLVTGIALTIICSGVFILTRQPYADNLISKTIIIVVMEILTFLLNKLVRETIVV